MKSLTKKLLSIFMVLCLTLLSFGLVVNVKAATVLGTTVDFETGFTVNNTAQTTTLVGPTGNQWKINFGTIKSSGINKNTAYLEHAKNTNNIASLSMEYGLDNVTKVTYDAKVSHSSVTFDIYYSTNNGAWISLIKDQKLSTKVNNYSIDFTTHKDLTNVKFKFELKSKYGYLNNGFIDNIKFYVNKNLPLLDTPVATLSGNTVTITPVANALSYNIALFDGLKCVKTYNTTNTTYVIPKEIQGNYDVKVQAVSDGTQFAFSAYSESIGKFDFPISKISISDFLALPVQNGEPYIYYELTGKVVSFKSGKTFDLTIKDSTAEIFVYNLFGSKDGTVDIKTKNIQIGDTLTLIGYRSEHKGTQQVKGGYYVNHEKNYLDSFVCETTMGSLNASYVTKQRPIQTDGNETIDNTFASLNLPNATFTENVELSVSTKLFFSKGTNTYGNTPKYYDNDHTMRCYIDNTMTINSINEITSVELTFESGNGLYTVTNGTFTTNGQIDTITPTAGTKEIILTFTKTAKMTAIKVTTKGAPQTIYEDYYEISKDQQTNKNDVALRFGTLVKEEVYNNLLTQGATVKFGVVYAKASELGTKTFDAAVADKTAHVEECAPELVGTDYQFAIVLNHIPATAFDDAVTAACYVEIDGVMHLMNAKTYSVNSIALEYVNAHATDANVKEHLEMLKWLSTYKETITK